MECCTTSTQLSTFTWITTFNPVQKASRDWALLAVFLDAESEA
jgi:hypothetical protein